MAAPAGAVFAALGCAVAPANVASVDCPCTLDCEGMTGGGRVDWAGARGGKIGCLAAGAAGGCAEAAIC